MGRRGRAGELGREDVVWLRGGGCGEVAAAAAGGTGGPTFMCGG